ncbi:polysaccharide deacetylase family protein [Selenomonas sp. WCA-380-WT-3B 3/]|uniref:Polysaccharide deacetylase family protein n=1 Tax=Selenomonas montiformis TaxID=2652285 RepID=A0A6I2V1M2_9FIRM|nr:polysaccharide deacetylase family protein [Selenomonas montiformis]
MRKKDSFLKKIRRIALAAGFLLLAFLCGLAFLPAPEGIPVLEYHMVADTSPEDGWAYNVPPEDFRDQLDYLREEGYTAISMLDYMKAKKGKAELPPRPVILTFDDGYESNYTTLLPILESYGMKATVYMVTNDIGLPGYLTWDELRDMQERGIEIGSHTANHQPLTEMDRSRQEEEMRLSKLLLEWNGIHTVFSFSYPNGAYDSGMPELLAQNGYLTAVTGDAGLNTFQTDPYLLQRINIPHPRFGRMEFRLRLFKAAVMTRLGIRQH